MQMDELYRVNDPEVLEAFRATLTKIMAQVLSRSGGAQEVARAFADRMDRAPWPAVPPSRGSPRQVVLAYRPALRHVRATLVAMLEETARNPRFRPEPGIPWSFEGPIMAPLMVKVREHFQTRGETAPVPRRK